MKNGVKYFWIYFTLAASARTVIDIPLTVCFIPPNIRSKIGSPGCFQSKLYKKPVEVRLAATSRQRPFGL